MIDVHVHPAALPDGKNGCHISEKTLKDPLFIFLCCKMGLPIHFEVGGEGGSLNGLLSVMSKPLTTPLIRCRLKS